MPRGHVSTERHLLGRFAAVACALSVITLLGLQYWSSSQLEAALPHATQHDLRARLDRIAASIETVLREDVERKLPLPESAQLRDATTDDTLSRTLFGGAETTGVRTYFVIAPAEPGQLAFSLYRPADGSMENNNRDDQALAVAAYFELSARVTLTSDLSHIGDPFVAGGDSHNPPIVIRGVRRETRATTATVGAIIDEAYYEGGRLPEIVRAAIEAETPGGGDAPVTFVLRDDTNREMLATGALDEGQEEVSRPLPWMFTAWTIAARPRETASGAWARRALAVNMSLAALMALIMAGALALAYSSYRRAAQLSQMKSDFISNMSHELRTPVASIRAIGESLHLGWYEEDGDVRRCGRYIESEGARLTKLIDLILDFSKLESGSQSFRFRPADLDEIAAAATDLFRARATAAEFDVQFLPAGGAPIRADRDALVDALLNLLDNAAKYSGDSRRVRVSVTRGDDACSVSVTDWGIGVSEEEHARIFERFYRVSTGRVHDVKGTGLGLAIVSYIVEAHGGTVEVESEPGRGSRFTVVLPAESTNTQREGGRTDDGQHPARRG